jgi:arsenical pump membrane protein
MSRLSGHDMPVQEDAAQEDAGKRRRGRLAILCKFSVLDWIRIGLFTAGILCVLTALLPAAQTEENLRRIAPLLLFLDSVIVLAKFIMQAQVFDVIATRISIMGRPRRLFIRT